MHEEENPDDVQATVEKINAASERLRAAFAQFLKDHDISKHALAKQLGTTHTAIRRRCELRDPEIGLISFVEELANERPGTIYRMAHVGAPGSRVEDLLATDPELDRQSRRLISELYRLAKAFESPA